MAAPGISMLRAHQIHTSGPNASLSNRLGRANDFVRPAIFTFPSQTFIPWLKPVWVVHSAMYCLSILNTADLLIPIPLTLYSASVITLISFCVILGRYLSLDSSYFPLDSHSSFLWSSHHGRDMSYAANSTAAETPVRLIGKYT